MRRGLHGIATVVPLPVNSSWARLDIRIRGELLGHKSFAMADVGDSAQRFFRQGPLADWFQWNWHQSRHRHCRILGKSLSLQMMEPEWLKAESWQSPVECT
jgi:hypothetical protein